MKQGASQTVGSNNCNLCVNLCLYMRYSKGHNPQQWLYIPPPASAVLTKAFLTNDALLIQPPHSNSRNLLLERADGIVGRHNILEPWAIAHRHNDVTSRMSQHAHWLPSLGYDASAYHLDTADVRVYTAQQIPKDWTKDCCLCWVQYKTIGAAEAWRDRTISGYCVTIQHEPTLPALTSYQWSIVL